MNYLSNLFDMIDIFDSSIDEPDNVSIDEYINELDLNQNIINNVYTIRRSLELRTINNVPISTNSSNDEDSFNNNESDNININYREEYLSYRENIHYRGQYLNYREYLNYMEIFENDFEDIKITLSECEFNNLDSVILDESILISKDCSICLDRLQLSNNLIILKCKHIYHKNCIREWFNQSTKCPICRCEIREQ